ERGQLQRDRPGRPRSRSRCVVFPGFPRILAQSGDGRRELRPRPARHILPMARKALIHQVEARERRGRWFGALASLLSISLVMSGWVALFMFLGTNSAYGSFEQIKDDWVPDTSAMPLRSEEHT